MKNKLIAGFAALTLAATAAVAVFPDNVAPPVRYDTIGGEKLSSADLKGKVVLVNFWATYCTTCVKEMPKLGELHARYAARGFETVAVAIKKDDPERIAQFAAANALAFKVAHDASGAIAESFGDVRITPVSFLIDREGRVLKRWIGEPRWDELDRMVEKALGG